MFVSNSGAQSSSTNVVVVQLKEWEKSSNWSGISSVIIAAIVALVGFQQYLLARQQHELAQEKFKLEMFDKRFAVYKSTQKFLTEIMRQPHIEAELAIQFLRETQDAVFLYGPEIVDYLDSLYTRAIDLNTRTLSKNEDQTNIRDREMKIVKELTHEITRLKDVFGHYLKFKVWS